MSAVGESDCWPQAGEENPQPERAHAGGGAALPVDEMTAPLAGFAGDTSKANGPSSCVPKLLAQPGAAAADDSEVPLASLAAAAEVEVDQATPLFPLAKKKRALCGIQRAAVPVGLAATVSAAKKLFSAAKPQQCSESVAPPALTTAPNDSPHHVDGTVGAAAAAEAQDASAHAEVQATSAPWPSATLGAESQAMVLSVLAAADSESTSAPSRPEEAAADGSAHAVSSEAPPSLPPPAAAKKKKGLGLGMVAISAVGGADSRKVAGAAARGGGGGGVSKLARVIESTEPPAKGDDEGDEPKPAAKKARAKSAAPSRSKPKTMASSASSAGAAAGAGASADDSEAPPAAALKKPASSYMLFVATSGVRSQVVSELTAAAAEAAAAEGDDEGSGRLPKIDQKEVARRMGERWKELSPADKEAYKQRSDAQIEMWKAAGGEALAAAAKAEKKAKKDAKAASSGGGGGAADAEKKKPTKAAAKKSAAAAVDDEEEEEEAAVGAGEKHAADGGGDAAAAASSTTAPKQPAKAKALKPKVATTVGASSAVAASKVNSSSKKKKKVASAATAGAAEVEPELAAAQPKTASKPRSHSASRRRKQRGGSASASSNPTTDEEDLVACPVDPSLALREAAQARAREAGYKTKTEGGFILGFQPGPVGRMPRDQASMSSVASQHRVASGDHVAISLPAYYDFIEGNAAQLRALSAAGCLPAGLQLGLVADAEQAASATAPAAGMDEDGSSDCFEPCAAGDSDFESDDDGKGNGRSNSGSGAGCLSLSAAASADATGSSGSCGITGSRTSPAASVTPEPLLHLRSLSKTGIVFAVVKAISAVAPSPALVAQTAAAAEVDEEGGASPLLLTGYKVLTLALSRQRTITEGRDATGDHQEEERTSVTAAASSSSSSSSSTTDADGGTFRVVWLPALDSRCNAPFALQLDAYERSARRALTPGLQVRALFQLAEDPSRGEWHEGRLYAANCARECDKRRGWPRSEYRSLRVLWYEQEVDTLKWSIEMAQTDNELSHWDVSTDSAYVAAANRAIFAVEAPVLTRPADVVQYVMATEAGALFKEPVPKKGNEAYYARFGAGATHLKKMLARAQAGGYDGDGEQESAGAAAAAGASSSSGGGGTRALWQDFATLIRNAKVFNAPDRYEWRLADEVYEIVRKLKRVYSPADELAAAAAVAAVGPTAQPPPPSSSSKKVSVSLVGKKRKAAVITQLASADLEAETAAAAASAACDDDTVAKTGVPVAAAAAFDEVSGTALMTIDGSSTLQASCAAALSAARTAAAPMRDPTAAKAVVFVGGSAKRRKASAAAAGSEAAAAESGAEEEGAAAMLEDS